MYCTIYAHTLQPSALACSRIERVCAHNTHTRSFLSGAPEAQDTSCCRRHRCHTHNNHTQPQRMHSQLTARMLCTTCSFVYVAPCVSVCVCICVMLNSQRAAIETLESKSAPAAAASRDECVCAIVKTDCKNSINL